METKFYIFLDIDGVLATSHQFSTNRKKWHPTYDCYRFDEKCVKVFNSIIEEVNSIIILSSDWKHHYSIDQLNEIFYGNKADLVISDVTPNLWGVDFNSALQLEICRAHEILKYVKEHNIVNWVAIDDLDLREWIPSNFVWCSQSFEGIKQYNVKEKIINLLN